MCRPKCHQQAAEMDSLRAVLAQLSVNARILAESGVKMRLRTAVSRPVRPPLKVFRLYPERASLYAGTFRF